MKGYEGKHYDETRSMITFMQSMNWQALNVRNYTHLFSWIAYRQEWHFALGHGVSGAHTCVTPIKIFSCRDKICIQIEQNCKQWGSTYECRNVYKLGARKGEFPLTCPGFSFFLSFFLYEFAKGSSFAFVGAKIWNQICNLSLRF